MQDEDTVKAALLTPRIDRNAPGEPVALKELGQVVRVRGLSRGEVLAMQALKDKGILDTQAKWEAHMFSWAMVYPRMTSAEVLEWQAASPAGEMEPVATKISELSALVEGADKSDLPSVRSETGGGVRILPGDQAVYDSEPPAAGDESD